MKNENCEYCKRVDSMNDFLADAALRTQGRLVVAISALEKVKKTVIAGRYQPKHVADFIDETIQTIRGIKK